MTQQHKRDGVLLNPFGGVMRKSDPCDPPPSPVSPLELTAFHEAAHAVFAALQGWPIKYVTIVPGCDETGCFSGSLLLGRKRYGDPHLAAQWCLSGLAGEAVLQGTRAFYASPELDQAHKIVGDAPGVFAAWYDVLELLGTPPASLALVRVADRLLDSGTLDYETALEIVHNAFLNHQPSSRGGDTPTLAHRHERRSGLSRRTFVFTPLPVRERRNGTQRRTAEHQLTEHRRIA